MQFSQGKANLSLEAFSTTTHSGSREASETRVVRVQVSHRGKPDDVACEVWYLSDWLGWRSRAMQVAPSLSVAGPPAQEQPNRCRKAWHSQGDVPERRQSIQHM